MRPLLLDPLFAPVGTLPSVGPRVAALLGKVIGLEDEPLMRDLLFHLPSGFIDRRLRPPLYETPPSGTITVEGTVERLEKPAPGRQLWRVVADSVTTSYRVALGRLSGGPDPGRYCTMRGDQADRRGTRACRVSRSSSKPGGSSRITPPRTIRVKNISGPVRS